MTHACQRPGTRLAATAAAVLAVTTVLLGAGAGHAAPPAEVDCAAIVVDDAGVVEDRRVQRAAQPLINEAADVRVVTFTSVPSGDLDEAVTKLQRACGLWSAEDGTLNDNMIVLAVSIQDRRSGLYYGASWSQQLLSSWPRIQARAMNPAFKEGDWTGGMVAGLRAVTRQIEAGWVDPGDDLSGHTEEVPYAESSDGSYGMTGMGESSGSGGTMAILGLGAAALAIAGVALGGGGGRFRPGGRAWRGGTAAGTSTGFTAGFLAGSMSHHHHHHHGGHTGGSGHGAGGGGAGGGGDGGGSSSF